MIDSYVFVNSYTELKSDLCVYLSFRDHASNISMCISCFNRLDRYSYWKVRKVGGWRRKKDSGISLLKMFLCVFKSYLTPENPQTKPQIHRKLSFAGSATHGPTYFSHNSGSTILHLVLCYWCVCFVITLTLASLPHSIMNGLSKTCCLICKMFITIETSSDFYGFHNNCLTSNK